MSPETPVARQNLALQNENVLTKFGNIHGTACLRRSKFRSVTSM